jgi:hypothetical protein
MISLRFNTFRVAAILLAIPALTSAGTLADKMPGYFVDRYGPAKKSKTVSSEMFHAPKTGMVAVKGQFSVREFQKGDLRIETIFLLPSLQLAGVRLHLTHTWTPEQVDAALSAYGDKWTLLDKGAVTTWIAPDGATASLILLSLHIQSKATTDLVAQTLAEKDTKRKAVPKF